MRLLRLIPIVGVLVACERPIDVRGLYVNDDGSGALVPCDQPKTLLTVTDSGLATRYRREATRPPEPLFVHLRGVRADSGSIYGGEHRLAGRHILRVRAGRAGGAPDAGHPAAPGVPLSAPPAPVSLTF